MSDYTVTVVDDQDILLTVNQTPPPDIITVNIGPKGDTGPSGSSGSKVGLVAAGSFSGTPLKASVVFATAYPNTLYSISISGVDSRAWTYESKTVSGFTINAQASEPLTGEVSWKTQPVGES